MLSCLLGYSRGVRRSLAVAIGSATILACEGSGGIWELEARLAEPEGVSAGCGLSVSERFAAVCSEDQGGARRVTVFRRYQSGNWRIMQRIHPHPSAPERRFGEALSLDGERLAIAAAREPGGEALDEFTRLGYIDVYRLRVVEGVERFELERSVQSYSDIDGVRNTSYGTTIALDGDTLVAGEAFVGEGRAFVYDLSTGLETVLSEPSPVTLSDQLYGTAVAAESGRIAVSKPQRCTDTRSPSVCGGEIYVYHRDGGDWSPELVVALARPADTSDFYRDRLGEALALGGDQWVFATGAAHRSAPSVFFSVRASDGESYLPALRFDTALAGRDRLAASESRFAYLASGTREDTGAETAVLLVQAIETTAAGGFSARTEGALVLPALEYGTRIAMSESHLLVSEPSAASALLFRRQP